MSYSEAKVYYDGSHYIAIPKELQVWKKRKRTVKEQKKEIANNKLLFEKLYRENLDKKHRQRKEEIKKGLNPYIKNEEELEIYVNRNMERMRKNAIVRKKRLYRKVNLQEWHYFCTFTYDNSKLTEQEFKLKFLNTLKHLSNRKGWKYIGVWERSPQNNRLHFHALMYAPIMIGTFEIIRDYSTKNHRMQIANQNTYFLERFGRNDFKEIEKRELSQAISYLTKYIEKSGEKIIYSKNLPTYFKTDILKSDIVCPIGNEQRKQLLFDDFRCWDNGVLVGNVSKEVIEQMPKCN